MTAGKRIADTDLSSERSEPMGWLGRTYAWLAARATGRARLAATTGAVAVACGCAGSSPAVGPAPLRPDEAALLAREGGSGPMPIVQTDPRAPAPGSVLRQRAEPLDPTDRGLGRLVERMRATLEESGGVGLAAPQVGVSRRLILIRHGTRPAGQATRIAVYVNPRIEWASDAEEEDYEACLSLPGVGGLVPRARQIRLRYQLPGKARELSIELGDWDARIAQHEMDHLDGKLYVDRLRGELLTQDETKRLRDEGHRRRGWLPPLEEPAHGTAAASGSGGHEHGHGQGAPHGSHGRFDDAERWAAVFDDPKRDAWQQPAEVVRLLELSPKLVVADIGAGTGYFLPHLHRAVGPEGRVLGLDVEPDMVRHMRERIARGALRGVEAAVVSPDDPGLGAASVDRVLIVNTWHHIGAREAYAARLAQALRPGGFVAVVDFTLEASHGPPPSERLAPAVVERELGAGGLQTSTVPESLPEQYVVIGRKAAAPTGKP